MNSISMHTLGCKLNFSESSSIGRQLIKDGYDVLDFPSIADVYLLNTCSVTENADKKCRAVVRQALRYNPLAKVVVIGCYAQLKPEEIAGIPGVSMVLGAQEKFNLVQHLNELRETEKALVYNSNIKEATLFVSAFSLGDRTRSFLKVQDGCDYFCSFCTIPLARGKSRSAGVSETVEKAREIADTDVREVVLTGVNIGDFGSASEETFYDLIRELDKIEGIDRFRISSIEPNLLNNEIISFVHDSQKFVPHFHIPLQSGDNSILKSMRRKYERELYADRIAKIKDLMPDACIGADVIVGYPGESDSKFEITFEFLRELDISYLHVFPYSQRANTTARKLPDQVPLSVKTERASRLRILSEKKKRAFYESQLGKTLQVLLESDVDENGFMHGFSRNYVRFAIPYDPGLVNKIIPLKFDRINQSGNAMTLSVHEMV